MGATRAARPAPERGAATHGVAERRLSALQTELPLSLTCARAPPRLSLAAPRQRLKPPRLAVSYPCAVLPHRARSGRPRGPHRDGALRGRVPEDVRELPADVHGRTPARRGGNGLQGYVLGGRSRVKCNRPGTSGQTLWCVCVSLRLCECGFPWAAQAAEVCSALVVSMP